MACVTDPSKINAVLIEAQKMAKEHRVPVVVEVILEKVTNIAMGTEINNVNEFEDILIAVTLLVRKDWLQPVCSSNWFNQKNVEF